MKIAVSLPGSRPFVLDKAILLYRGAADEHLAIEHPVYPKDGGGAALGAGKLVTKSIVNTLLTLMGNEPLTYVDPSVVAVAHKAIAWFVPAGVRPLYFKVQHDESVARFDGVPVPHPALMFVARPGQLRVYAIPSGERPTKDTVLAHAPFWNVYNDHRVCLGTMSVPEAVRNEDTAAWTEAFFRSNFTHLAGNTGWVFPGTYSELLDAAIARGSFDPAWLYRTTVTVEKALT